MESFELRKQLGSGLVIPACPLALTARRKFDDLRQRALLRYYVAAGAGGVAVGVHTTQFAIRDPKVGLFKPVLELAAEELRSRRRKKTETSKGEISQSVRFSERGFPTRSTVGIGKGTADYKSAPLSAAPVCIAGLCGPTAQAISETTLARELGYDAGLLSLGAQRDTMEDELIAHCRSVADVIPLFGFYLQPAVGGRVLPYSFWRRFAEIENVVAIKIAPFNRYQTLDVIRAVAETGRHDIALYTGNDDNIVMDLLTPFRFETGGKKIERRIVGGLLGQWAVWTKRAVELHAECRRVVTSGGSVPTELLRRAAEVTDSNAAFFDAMNNFAGCIPGIHEILRRQALFEGIWCLDPKETLSPGQREEIGRVCHAYPHLNDDDFVRENLDEWMR